jgi:hypothetical protein
MARVGKRQSHVKFVTTSEFFDYCPNRARKFENAGDRTARPIEDQRRR